MIVEYISAELIQYTVIEQFYTTATLYHNWIQKEARIM